MAQGVKKIKFAAQSTGANNSNSEFSPDRWVRIPADKKALFCVKEWHKESTLAQKNGSIYWMVLNHERTKIISRLRCMTNKYFVYAVPKHLCGEAYYIEASMSGKPDADFTGLMVVGKSPALITTSAWTRSRGSQNLKNTNDNNDGLCYGDEINFHANTEGINGKIVTVEVHNEMWTGDYKMRTLYNVMVIDGQINLKITNTTQWISAIKNIQDNEEFYVKIKVKDGEYLKDKSGNLEHGKYLNIKKLKRTGAVAKPPENQVALLVDNTDKNIIGIGACKFKQITINDGTFVNVFNEGKTQLKKGKASYSEIIEYVYFDFDKNVVRSDAMDKLNVLASKLKNNRHSTVIIEGHADERGPGDYNLRLSQNRSEAVATYLKQKIQDKTKFQPQGLGENYLIYKGSNLTQAQHQQNRRAKIRFSVTDSDENSLVYVVIATPKESATPKYLDISVPDFENKGCYGDHIKKIGITDIGQVKKGNEITNFFSMPTKKILVHSDLLKSNPVPIKYIWPASSTPNKYNVDVHSCTYFANKHIPTIVIKVYPDIKWRFAFLINLSNSASIKWQRVSPQKHIELRDIALKLANEERLKYSEVDFGVELKASFDKIREDLYGSNPELTGKYTDKIYKLFSAISSIKKIAQGVTGGTKGVVSKGIGRRLPFRIEFNFAAVYFGADWEAVANVNHTEIGTKLNVFLETKPFVELALVVDLLSLAIQAGVAVATAGSGNTLALEIFNKVREWSEKGYEGDTVKASFRMYIDLEVKGKVDGSGTITYNTVSPKREAKLSLVSNVTVELKAGLELKAMYVVIGTVKKPELEGHAEGTLSAGAEVGITSEHNLEYDSNLGIYYVPGLKVDPCIGSVLLVVKVGFTYKKVTKDWTPINYNRSRTFFEEFDILDKLSSLTGFPRKILLWKKKN